MWPSSGHRKSQASCSKLPWGIQEADSTWKLSRWAVQGDLARLPPGRSARVHALAGDLEQQSVAWSNRSGCLGRNQGWKWGAQHHENSDAGWKPSPEGMIWIFLSRGFIFWPGEFHALCSPQGCKESNITDRFSLSLFLSPETLPTHTIGGILCAAAATKVFFAPFGSVRMGSGAVVARESGTGAAWEQT